MMHRAAAADRVLLADFASRRVEPGSFGHRQHLSVAYTLLVDHDVDAAVAAMRTALLGLLAHHHLDPAKYHETMTRAWLLAVHHFMANTRPCAGAGEFLAANPRLLDRGILRRHYSAAVLSSAAARSAFVEPDLAPIPRLAG